MKFFVLINVFFLVLSSTVSAEGPNGFAILSKHLRQYIRAQPENVKLSDGINIISTKSENDARASGDDGTLLGVIENYLEHHEVRIKLEELMPGDRVERALKSAMDEVESKEEKSLSFSLNSRNPNNKIYCQQCKVSPPAKKS
ncbi:hypothetical protein GWI33_021742 [Rhynchophorus ferrugineus]|uniref:Uncharacterized protein n=1 Tax=Rhynchophorus ferrugineus TaxID=354439 RepID=A0A834HSE2_RHYFE|nr:hypothetical protein GWI33_021742 [Rhynchophorus ferrugineus]